MSRTADFDMSQRIESRRGVGADPVEFCLFFCSLKKGFCNFTLSIKSGRWTRRGSAIMFERRLPSADGVFGQGLPDGYAVKEATFLFQDGDTVLQQRVPLALKLELQLLFAAMQLFWRVLAEQHGWDSDIGEPTNVDELIDLFNHFFAFTGPVQDGRCESQLTIKECHATMRFVCQNLLPRYTVWTHGSEEGCHMIIDSAIEFAIVYLKDMKYKEPMTVLHRQIREIAGELNVSRVTQRTHDMLGNAEMPDAISFFEPYRPGSPPMYTGRSDSDSS